MVCRKKVLVLFLITSLYSFGQETLPVYSDYLSDNMYLVHAAAAGIGNCGKIRTTGRLQWVGVEDAPSLQTLSAHASFGQSGRTAGGLIVFNDKNGYHSQQGIQATFAYHIDLGRADDINQFSFALSALGIYSTLDESSYVVPDPVITQIANSKPYYNLDAGIAYHNLGFFSYFTAKNILLSPRNLYNPDLKNILNLRRYLFTVGYFLNKSKKIQWEPSIMFQTVDRTGEQHLDVNLKAYSSINKNAQLWAAVSYRRSLDNSANEELSYITPIIGINFNKFMLSYTYSKQFGEFIFEGSGFHQLSLGFNFSCKAVRRLGCPNINATF